MFIWPSLGTSGCCIILCTRFSLLRWMPASDRILAIDTDDDTNNNNNNNNSHPDITKEEKYHLKAEEITAKEREEYLQKSSCIVLISNVTEEEEGEKEDYEIFVSLNNMRSHLKNKAIKI